MKVKIKDIAKVINGATPSTDHAEYYNGDIIWVTPKDLSDQNSKFFWKGERTISQKGYDSCSTEMIPAGNLLISSRAPIGLISINKVDCCTNQGFKSLIIDNKVCDVEFIYYYFKLHLKEIEALGSGTTFKEISKVSMENYEIELPSLDIQKSIVNILSQIDLKIINNTKIISELESLAKTIYDYWFIQFDFPDENGCPYRSSGGKMVWNEELKKEIPEGWEVETITSLMQMNIDSISPQKTPDLIWEYYSIPAFDDKKYPIFTFGEAIQSNKYKVIKGSILISKLNPQFKRIWRPLCLTENRACSTEFICIVPRDMNDKEYCYSLLNSDKFHKHLIKGASSSTGSRSRVQSEVMFDYKDAFGTKNIIDLYSKKVKALFSMSDKLYIENAELTALRDFLLPLLMNGQVKIKE